MPKLEVPIACYKRFRCLGIRLCNNILMSRVLHILCKFRCVMVITDSYSMIKGYEPVKMPLEVQFC